MSAKTVSATFYAQVEPKLTRTWSRQQGEWLEDVKSAKVVGLTQQRPTRQRSGTVLVKLTLQIPAAAFLPLRPEAVVVIPEDMTVVAPIEVEAIDPADEEVQE